MANNRSFTLGRLQVETSTSEVNYHGLFNPDAGHGSTVRQGGRLINMHVANAARSYWGYRIIRYRRDGSYRMIDIFWLRRGAKA